MSETIKYSIEANDNGSFAKVNNEAKKVHDTVSKTQKLLKEPIKPASQSSAYKNAKEQSESGSYGLARGTVGTGAEGRDFAKTAQGLGGLVHVYATFAANIFAVSAAFTALSKAADVTNMVKGLDQLGAAQGRSLGSLAKSLTIATDGALSLKDAMVATAQASAAGMGADQLKRLTAVARNASQALGRDMSDSMSRLTRGVTKLEPELLDEIGIFTKVDKAVADYARTVGKTATSLTDFERRQAFAIAAIEEGERKFNAIKLDANPYSKLLASFTNLAITGGELINKVLGPIAKLLAESPVALGATMAGITSLLLSKAIPALTQWRSGLVETAKQAAATAAATRQAAEDFAIGKSSAEANAIVDPLKKAYNKGLAEIHGNLIDLFGESSKLASKVVSDGFKLNEGVVSKYSEQVTRMANKLTSLQKVDTQGLSKEQLAIHQKMVDTAQARLTKMQDTTQAARDQLVVLERIAQADDKASSKIDKIGYQEQGVINRARRAESKAESATILSNVGSNTQIMGMADAWKKLRMEVKYGTSAVASAVEEHGSLSRAQQELINKGQASSTTMGKVRSAFTLLSGGAQIATSGIMNLAFAFQNVFMVIGIATAIFSVLDGVLSKNKKETEAFNSSLDGLNESVNNTSRTLETISQKPFLEQLSPESIQARANAFSEMSGALSGVIKDLEKVQMASSGWDKGIDKIKSLWGGDNKSKANESIAKSIESSITLISDSKVKAKLESKLNNVLGKVALKSDSIEKALDNLAPEKHGIKIKELEAIYKEMNIEISNSASKLTSLQNTFTNAAKDVDTFVNALKPSDGMSKIAMNYMELGKVFQSLEGDSEQLFSAFVKLTDSFEQLKALPTGMGEALLKFKPQISAITKEAEQFNKVLESQNLALAEAQEQSKGDTQLARRAKDRVKAIEEVIKSTKGSLLKIEIKRDELNEDLKAATKGIFDEGIKALDISLGQSFAKAGLIIQKAILDGVSGEGVAKMQADIAKQELAIQMDVLNSQYQLALSNDRLRLAVEESTLITQRESLKRDLEDSEGKSASQVKYTLNKLEKTEDSITRIGQSKDVINATMGMSATQAQSYLKAFMASAKEFKEDLYSSYVNTVALRGKMAEIAAQIKAIDIKANIGALDEQLQAKTKIYENDKASRELEIQKLGTLDSLAGSYTTIFAQQKLVLAEEQKLADLAQQQAILDTTNDKWNIRLKNATAAQRVELELIKTKELSDLRTKNSIALSKSENDIINQKVAIKTRELNISLELAKISSNNKLELDRKDLELKQQAYDIVNSIYSLDKDTQIEAKRAFAIEQQALTLRKELMDAEFDNQTKLNQLIVEKARFEESLTNLKRQQKDIEEKGGSAAQMKALLDAETDLLNKLKGLGIVEEHINTLYQNRLVHLASVNEKVREGIELAAKSEKFLAAWGSTIKLVEDTLTDALKLGMEKSSKEGWKKFFADFKTRSKDLIFEVAFKPQVEMLKNAFIALLPGGEDFLKNQNIPKAQLNVQEKILDVITRQGLKNPNATTVESSLDKILSVNKQDIEDLTSTGWDQQRAAADLHYLETGEIIDAASIKFDESGDSFKVSGKTMKMAASSFASTTNVLMQAASVMLQASGSNNPAMAAVARGLGTISSSLASGAMGGLANENLGWGMMELGDSLGAQWLTNMGRDTFVGATGATAVSSTGTIAPYVGSIMKLLQGDITGAATTAIGAAIGNVLLPGLGGTIGAVLGDLVGGLLGEDKFNKPDINFNPWNATSTNAIKDTANFKDPRIAHGAGGLGGISIGIEKGDADIDSAQLVKDMMDNYIQPLLDIETNISKLLDGTKVELLKDKLAAVGATREHLTETNSEDYMMARIKTVQDEIGGWINELTDTYSGSAQEMYTLTLGLLQLSTEEYMQSLAEAVMQPGALVGLQKDGEQTANTFLRLAGSLVTINGMFQDLGLVLYSTSLGGAAAAANLSEVFGGLENLTTATTYYFDNFYSSAEKAELLGSKLSNALSETTIALNPDYLDTNGVIKSKEAFKTIIDTLSNTQQLLTVEGQNTFKELMNLAPSLINYWDQLNSAANSVDDATLQRAKLENEIAVLMGSKTQDQISLEEELVGALDAHNATLIRQKYALQALKSTLDMQVEILRMEGKATEALALQRSQTLKTIAPELRAGQRYIWQLEDQKTALDALNAGLNLQVQILKLEGKTVESTALSRQMAIAAMAPELQSMQQYLWALEDKKALEDELTKTREDEVSAVKNTISSLKSAITSIKEYRRTLLLDQTLSPLTPEQKYQEAKSSFESILSLAMMPLAANATEAETAAKNDALSKLPTVSSDFLQASRTLFASSQSYINDYNTVSNALASLESSLTSQATGSEVTLSSIEASMGSVDTNTRDAATILRDISAVNSRIEQYQAASAAALANLTTASNDASNIPDSSFFEYTIRGLYDSYVGAIPTNDDIAVWQTVLEQGFGTITDIVEAFQYYNNGAMQVFDALTQAGVDYQSYFRYMGVPGYANGGLPSGISLVGEEGAELVDFRTPARVYSNNDSANLFNGINRNLEALVQNLILEVRELRTEQREQTGHLINSNYDASITSSRNIAEEIEKAQKEASWNARTAAKAA